VSGFNREEAINQSFACCFYSFFAFEGFSILLSASKLVEAPIHINFTIAFSLFYLKIPCFLLFGDF
jgi:hypothetical protein